MRHIIDYNSKQLEFQKLKKKVQRICPRAKTVARSNGTFTVADRNGRSVIREEHYMPPAETVWDAWKQAAVVVHAGKVISGNGKAFKASKKARELAAAMEGSFDDNYQDDII